MRGRVHICPVLDLDSFGGTIRQSPKFPLNIALSDIDFAKCSMQIIARRWTRSMGVPPRECKCSISSLERWDRVLVSFFETKIVTLGE